MTILKPCNSNLVNSSKLSLLIGGASLQRYEQLLLACILSLFAICVVAGELKVGYVQVDKLLKLAPQTSATGKKLEQEFRPRSEELNKLKQKIRTLESELDNIKKKIKDTDRRVKERKVSNLKLDFQRKQREFREDINFRKNEELAKLQNRINDAVKNIAETEHYDLVVYGGVAYASKQIDLTDKVLKLLGEK